MADTHTKEQRSQNMSAIRSKGNKTTELAFLKLLKENHITGWRRHLKTLPGKPDFAFPKQKFAVFIDGCFWHGCPKCYKRPKSNKEYWDGKVTKNRERDKRVNKILKAKGWRVLRFWECKVDSDPTFCIKKIKECLDDL